jgi:hypothetical protein
VATALRRAKSVCAWCLVSSTLAKPRPRCSVLVSSCW